MMKERFLALLFSFVFFCNCSFCQIFYEIAGDYKSSSAQGMAIHGTTAYLLSDKGYCRVIDLKKRELLSEFLLASGGKNNHANSASFGIEHVGKNKQSLIYISECHAPFRCFVENITTTNSTLIQTISLKREGYDSIAYDWIVDRKTKSLYSIASRNGDSEGEGWTYVHRINRYRLPRMSEGKEVVLTGKDLIESFDVFFPNLLQGGTIKGKHLYLPTGRNQTQKNMRDAERALIVVNLRTNKIVRKIILSDITDNEPEDCDFYKGRLLLYCGQLGGLYKIPIK